MQFSHFCVNRPIFASVISIVIVIVGAISYLTLPVAQYPEIAPPTIVVTATYNGASAKTIAETVATPIEQEVNGVEGMLYMYSQSTNDGVMSLTITFEIGTDLDTAQVLVQNRVAAAEPRLPEEVRNIGVTTRKSSPDMLMVIHMLSPDNSRDQLYISNYGLLQVKDVLSRIDGVGNIRMFGARDYSMRIWLDPDRMTSLEVTASDVMGALREQNIQIAGGSLGEEPLDRDVAFQTAIQLQGRLSEPSQFENIIVKASENGQVTRIRDVARVELGALSYVTNSYLSGDAAVVLAVFQRPGSNALETADNVQAKIRELSQDFPDGLDYQIIYNPTEFIAESISELIKTIFEAVALVILVILIFLQSFRAALIPILAIPVSLIGTFAVMAAFGFSINNLTLFGLVLAVGIVVDDAIIIVENIERNLRAGMSPKEAAHRTIDEVGSAIIATTLVLVAVFVPTAFVGGITGQFFTQFALTIAVSTVISSIVSLTLSPAVSGVLFTKHVDAPDVKGSLLALFHGFNRGFNRAFDRLSDLYATFVKGATRMGPAMLAVYAILIGVTYWGFQKVPGGFIPMQDQSYLITVMQLPAGSSLGRADKVLREAENILLETPGIAHTASFAGFNAATFTNATNAGAIFAVMEPYQERLAKGLNMYAVLGAANQRLQSIQEAFIFVIPPPPVRGVGTGGGFKMMIQDRNNRGLDVLQASVYEMMFKANADPGLQQVFTPFQSSSPQLFVDVDRTRAEMLNVPLGSVFDTIEVAMGATYVNDFNLFGRTYRVTAQADSEHRLTEDDIRKLRARSTTGDMVPLGSLVTFRDAAGPDRVPRYNLYPTAELQGSTAPGISSSYALEKMAELAKQVLPYGLDFEWTDLSYQEVNEGNTAMLIFPLCVLFVFLFLAAQYESWSLPVAIILIVPMCLMSAILGVMARGMDNNILTQVGFVVLVGLASKNAILIVEFARQLEREGKDRFEAAIEACRLRLRPILMTSFAFILGVVPLVIASGAGMEMRQALGTAVFFGMIGVTIFGLLFTPVFYTLIRGLAGRREEAARKAMPWAAIGCPPSCSNSSAPRCSIGMSAPEAVLRSIVDNGAATMNLTP